MTNTNKGVYYPTSDESITPLETVLGFIAAGADNVGVISGSKLFTGPSNAGEVVTVTVTFASALEAAPIVTATVKGGNTTSVYAVTIVGATSESGFTAKVFRCDGSTAENDLYLNWMASTYDL